MPNSEIIRDIALSGDAMQRVDRWVIDQLGISSLTLMESAGKAVSQMIADRFGHLSDKRVGIFCGQGNNGGDGLAIARFLLLSGTEVTVYILTESKNLSADAQHNLHTTQQIIAKGNKGKIQHLQCSEDFVSIADADFFIDALLGTGFKGALSPFFEEIITWLNQQHVPVISVDIPSGLDATTGRVESIAVNADLTLTLAVAKIGLLLNDGPDYTGHYKVVDIGIPHSALRGIANESYCVTIAHHALIQAWLPKRYRVTHKYQIGYLLAVVGSRDYAGAAALSVQAASRAGVGGVICTTVPSAQPIVQNYCPEAITLGLQQTDTGTLGVESLSEILERSRKCKATLIGCGLGRSKETGRLIEQLFIECANKPTVIDADGLYILAEMGEDFIRTHAHGKWILTPHEGEFQRLLKTIPLTSENRLTLLQEKSKAWNCVILLKGFPSIIGCPDGKLFLNPTGNSAAATAGSGDVLAGICAGLLAQGLSPSEAAVVAMYLAGCAVDLYSGTSGAGFLMASDIIQQLPIVLQGFSKGRDVKQGK
ncbi:MAG: NAD(P)H-hydrate dehydratase [Alphaproteobacteria bacterium]|nr:NAD(P)H-hydrate dehydratase [Alphaproteobacteria bacterium]